MIKFIPHEDPTRSYFELDDDGRKYLAEKIKNEYLESLVYSAQMYLYDGNTEKAKEYIFSLTDESWDNIDEQVKQWENWLNSPNGHDGSCVCSPGTCMKCSVEGVLGVNSMEGLDKYMANNIASASYYGKNIEGAIQRIKTSVDTWYEGDDELNKRWKGDAERALEWLIAYRDKYFPRNK